MKKGPLDGYLSFFDPKYFKNLFSPFYTYRGASDNLQMLNSQNLPTLLCNVHKISVKYTLTQYNIAQYCRQELCCCFPYSFRLSKAKDRLSTDEGSRCQFFIHKHSLLYRIRDIFPLIVRVQLCTASQHIKPNLLMTFIKFSFSFLLLKNPGPLKIL